MKLTEEEEMLRSTIREFVKKEVEPQASLFDEEERFNQPLFRQLGALGLLGATVPERYGGSDLSPLAIVLAHEELSSSDPALCLSYLAHALLCVNNIVVNGGEDQKERYLPKLCSGEWIGAMAMSEPEAGTDVLGMKTTATSVDEGFRLNGRKMWITNGVLDDERTPCDLLFLYARAPHEDDRGRVQLSSFLVERGTSGFYVGQRIKGKLGMRASYTAELCFDDCLVPRTSLVGKEGDAMLHMMRNLEIERLGLAAMSLGIARRALEVMIRYAEERSAFGKSLHQFGQIQQYIGESYAEYRAARSYVYEVARNLQLDAAGNRIDSDGVKLFAAPVGKRIADRAIQVLGGYGYVAEYVVERLWRDAKLLEIGGGTLEAHQKNITKDLIKRPELLLE
ncbi:acyl-CoA dehydrogenase family protein [bacterium]|nr:acyl-CoA dehydrogenase family protein [bacterium]